MLLVEGLEVEVSGKKVVNGVSFELERGELIIIMGPNGSGKSSLAYAIMGHPRYKVVSGRIVLDGVDITNKPPHERALAGLFLGFQNPVEVPGVSLEMLIKTALGKRVGGDPSRIPGLEKRITEEAALVGLKEELVKRDLNVGFSGGEKKRAEILQARILRPKYLILDEPDSGLDIDGVRMIADYIKEVLSAGSSVILISHYPRLSEYLEPSRVYVMVNGRFAAEGGAELIERITSEGYKWLGVS